MINLNARLDAFQFASKVYESLISASLLSMVIYILKVKISDGGISLGYLISSFEINNIGCLGTSVFWSGLNASPKGLFLQHRLYRFLLYLSAILAAISGPFSAIAFIPRVDWWPIQPSDAGPDAGLANPYYTATMRSQIWPMVVSKPNLPTEDCLSLNATENSMYPAAGYSEILEQLFWESFTFKIWDQIDEGIWSNVNLTISGASSSKSPRLLTSPNLTKDDPHARGTIGTSISQILARDLGLIFSPAFVSMYGIPSTLLYKLDALSGSKPFKPVVQVLCDSVSPNVTKFEFPHYALKTPPFVSHSSGTIESPLPNIYKNEIWTMDVDTSWNRTLVEEHIKNGTPFFTWIDLLWNKGEFNEK